MRRAVRSGGVSLGGVEEEEGREEGEQKTQPLSRRLRSLESPLRPPRRELTLRPLLLHQTFGISSDLINQLAGGDDKVKKKTKKPKPKISKPQNNVKPVPSTQKSSSTRGWPLQPALFMPVPPPDPATISELEAIRSVLRESQRTVEKLEKHQDKMNQELTQRAKELRDKEFKLPHQNSSISCAAERDACLNCYKQHSLNPLKCAQVVKSFADCARQARLQVS
ncbi:hypothetical protein BHE74_00012513 [Ensete ventricosum]|nr:hypothetical protein BHE74_00012513 [Ensete ventricosum]